MNELYVSTASVPNSSASFIIPNKIYKVDTDGIFTNIHNELGRDITICVDSCAHLNYVPWDRCTKEEYLKQQILNKETELMGKELNNDRDVLQALLDGKTIQYIEEKEIRCEWYMVDGDVLRTNNTFNIIPTYRNNCSLKIKPKTISINGYEIPEPIRTIPEEGSAVYSCIWTTGTLYYSSFYHKNLLEEGFLHYTKEAAILHRKALASLTTLKKEGINENIS